METPRQGFPAWSTIFFLKRHIVLFMDRIRGTRALRWYVREWRDKCRLSQEQLANRLDTNKGQISKLENQKQRLNDDWVLGIADALGIEPRDLLRDPAAPTVDDLLRDASPDDRATAIRLVEAFLKRA